jgi:hypothetical protein
MRPGRRPISSGTPPVQLGRPMILDPCQPKFDEEGNKPGWGQVPNRYLWDPKIGWCEAKKPNYK